MSSFFTSKIIFFGVILFSVLVSISFPQIVSAQNYTPYVNIPGFEYDPNNLTELINQIYTLLIVVGCLFAVIKITIAGMKWSLSDIVSNKHDAMHDIQGVLIGLALLLAPAIVLGTINKDLLDLNVLKSFGESIGGVNLTPDPAALPLNLQKQVCVPKSNDPEDIQACITKLNCSTSETDVRAGIQHTSEGVVCVYTRGKTAVVDGQVKDTCIMETDTPENRQTCLDNLECFDAGRTGDISIEGRAVTCNFKATFVKNTCTARDRAGEDKCISECTSDRMGSITFVDGYEYPIDYICRKVSN